MARRRGEVERLALSLGFRVEPGKKHSKVFDKNGRLIAVFPLREVGRPGSRLNNVRACLMRAAREEAGE